jgi:DNA-binding LacI/PurR family transcriptional regulator
VPQELSIATFAPENFREHGLTVSAMLEPHYLLGREAVRLLRGRVVRPTQTVASQALGFTWLDLDTCVPPASLNDVLN